MKVKDKSNKSNAVSGAASNAASGFSALFVVLGGACCWGPLFFSIIGVGASTGGVLGSTASFLGVIAPYRNYFLILNIIGILLSFSFIYIMPKISLKKSAPSTDCDCETKGSFNLSKIVFFLSFIITVGMFTYLYADTGQIFTAWPAV
ncbi:MAG: hypothetical protein M1412_00120 [Deltaproteobacteria bacterium]|nr:hypothetical protein [Deltaproteobacteria bacterium]MCL5891557.1 hypothetical protein [Deltaproteobacteria bacterium]